MQCTEIVTEQSVCTATSVLLQTVGWSVHWPWVCQLLSHSQVSAVRKVWSFLLRCSVLTEGPSNGSMMARQTTLFGTIAEKAQFFKRLPSADDNAGYYAGVEALWALDCVHCVCV